MCPTAVLVSLFALKVHVTFFHTSALSLCSISKHVTHCSYAPSLVSPLPCETLNRVSHLRTALGVPLQV